jgi:hypothetical protein
MAYYNTGYNTGVHYSGDGGVLAQGIFKLQEIGVMDIILPFILVFTIVFAVLQKTKILGHDDTPEKRPRKNFNAVLGLVMALAVVVPHITGSYPSEGSDVVNIINSALPNISVVLIAVVMMLLMIGVFGGEVNIFKSGLAGWAVAFAIAATIFIFGTAAYWWELPQWMDFLQDSDTQALIVILLVFGALIAFITADDHPKDKGKYSFIEDLGRIGGYRRDEK